MTSVFYVEIRERYTNKTEFVINVTNWV